MAGSLQKYRGKYPGRFRGLLALQAGLLMPLVEIWLRCTSFKACQRHMLWLARELPFRRSQPLSAEEAESLARLVEKGNLRYSIYTAACLTRSLVLQYLLARRGAESGLCLGVRTITGRFEAHAWIEYRGRALNEQEPPREVYTHLDWKQATGGADKRPPFNWN